MSVHRAPARSAVGKPRMEALSDGLYAIALTLLVLELKLPPLPVDASDAAIRGALVALLPKGLAWMLSFWVIALFWVRQQRLYRYLAALDPALVRLELLGLAIVSLLPFSTALMGEYGDRVTPAAIYAGHLAALALATLLRTSHFLRHPALQTLEISIGAVRRMRLHTGLFAACALAALGLAFLMPGWNMLALLPTLATRMMPGPRRA
ncbi:MAG: hypothetical protein JWQ03_2981 [Variovorax sp.]|nr:hypothetical protein [Variovorax sp.]